jgi:hypothetical protein
MSDEFEHEERTDPVKKTTCQVAAQYLVPVVATITVGILLSPPVTSFLRAYTTSWFWTYVIILLLVFVIVYLVDTMTLEWRNRNCVRCTK